MPLLILKEVQTIMYKKAFCNSG